MRNSSQVRAAGQFAQWLGEIHPEVYQAVFAHAIAQGVNAPRGLGSLGDDSGGYDFSSFAEPALQDIQVDTGNLDYVVGSSMSDIADALPLFDLSSSSVSPQTGSGRTTGTGTGSGGGITGAIGSVGQWLTSAQGLTAVTNLGTAVLHTVATADVAKTQMAVIQAQAQRAQAGLSPAPITYMQGTNGQLIPVYATGTGQQIPTSLVRAIGNGQSRQVALPNGGTGYTLNNSTLSSVLGGGGMTWALLLGGGLLLALALGNT